MKTLETFSAVAGGRAEAGERNQGIVFSILEKYKEGIPPEIWNESLFRIKKVFTDFNAPESELRGRATSAFLIHTRRNGNGNGDGDVGSAEFKHLDDSTRAFPIFDPKYGITEKDAEFLWNSLPPFEVGKVTGFFGEKKITCALISIPITPQVLTDCKSSTERINLARPRIYQGAKLARKMGANILGLGETLASLTMHGKKLQEQFPEVRITTGHALTTHFMYEWTKFAAEAMKIKISDSAITIIGANGAIGSAIMDILLKEGVGELRLHDKNNMIGALNRKVKEIEEQYPRLKGKVKVTGEDENLREACRGSRLVLVASSAPRPFIKSEHLDPGTFVINDSQPPGITRKEAQNANSMTLWTVGSLPPGFKNTFNSGLISAEWTCLLESLALEAYGLEMPETTGPVTLERVERAGEIAKKAGMRLADPQSWGVLEKIVTA